MEGGSQYRPKKILVSTRSFEKSKVLKDDFPDIIDILEDVNEIVEKSSIVFIGLLPNVARDLLPKINFANKYVVSMMAAIDMKELLTLLSSTDTEISPFTVILYYFFHKHSKIAIT